MFEVGDVAMDLRTDVGVDECRRSAFELRGGRHDLVRQGEHHLGPLLAHDLGRALLVHRVGEREQKHHRERLHPLVLEPLDRGSHRRLVERDHDVPLKIEPLGDADAPPPRAERERRRQGGVPDVLLEAAAELDLIAMPLRGQQGRHRTGLRDHRIVGRGGGVHDRFDRGEQVAQRALFACRELFETLHHPARRVGSARRRLVEHERAVGAEQSEVREGAAHIDADARAAP